jgi:hypothetical protein
MAKKNPGRVAVWLLVFAALAGVISGVVGTSLGDAGNTALTAFGMLIVIQVTAFAVFTVMREHTLARSMVLLASLVFALTNMTTMLFVGPS